MLESLATIFRELDGLTLSNIDVPQRIAFRVDDPNHGLPFRYTLVYRDLFCLSEFLFVVEPQSFGSISCSRMTVSDFL